MRLIDADTIFDGVAPIKFYFASMIGASDVVLVVDHVSRIYMNAIKNAPTVDAVPVVHAKWIEDSPRERKCSACGNYDNPKTAVDGRYCWFCGARMDGEAE